MANVRVFGYAAMVQLPVHHLTSHNADSVFVRQEPSLWSQVLALNGSTPVETTVNSPDKAVMIVIEVDDGSAIRYEINLQGPMGTTHRNAGTASPKLTGENVFQWVSGASLSVVDASAV